MENHQEIREKLSNWLQTQRCKGTHLLQKLVQAQSTQGNEADAQKIIIDTLTKMKLEIDVWEPDGKELKAHPYFASSKDNFQGSPNVVGVLKGKKNGRSIILNGHIDVVPEGDLEQWEDDPYSGKVRDGKMFGRGVTDMKGGNVSLILAIQAIQAMGIQLKGDVIFESVIEEESGGTGTLASIVRGYRADAAIIPEPTNMKIFPKQQGSMWFRILVKGRSAHGGTRYQGISAIEKGVLVVNHILALEKDRNSRITDPLYEGIPIPIPINIGKIEGGQWPSSVCDLVKIEGRMGVSPDETMEDAQKDMEQWLQKLGETDTWFAHFPPKLEWFGARWHPGSIPITNQLMTALAKNYQLILKEKPLIEASPWGTDGGLLTKLAETPSIVFGPGVTEKAHFPNEYIEINKVFEAAEIIALTIIDWCEIDQ
ncbi:peptidase [Halalkalibacter okhensis]|uniref:Acetylornithine deacetylase n=1 Tax=Halalkalibacter okhensis TaxID=333138 RepID=A0A0B0IFV7_9BACI|nr:peptidase [Halalkalibacter okhensis]KHF38924.1 acetylornithine deacetylase [Halalkalibacter okhensis]